MKTFALVLLLVTTSLLALSQPKYFEYNNREALKLTLKRLEILTSTKWYFHQFSTLLRNDIVQRKIDGTITYNLDHTFNFKGQQGNWQIVDKRYIKHDVVNTRMFDTAFGGIYSIVKLTTSELVISKLQTSSGDMIRTYYLRTEPRSYESYQSTSIRINLDSTLINKLQGMTAEEAFMKGFNISGDSIIVPTQDSIYRFKIKK